MAQILTQFDKDGYVSGDTVVLSVTVVDPPLVPDGDPEQVRGTITYVESGDTGQFTGEFQKVKGDDFVIDFVERMSTQEQFTVAPDGKSASLVI